MGSEPVFASLERPRLLDLFCGVGGAGEGYRLAGFDVVGVDVKPQRYRAGMFIQSDALAFLAEGGAEGFDVIHASPPCQRYSSATCVSGSRERHADLIAPTREALEAIGLPWVIENVPRAPLIDPVMVCAAALGIRFGEYVLRRHRLFESSVALVGTGCGCRVGDGPSIGIYGGGGRLTPRSDSSGGDTKKATTVEAQALMAMPGATRVDLNQAIPPAYTELLGRQLMEHVRARLAA